MTNGDEGDMLSTGSTKSGRHGLAKIEMSVVLGRTVLSESVHRNPLRIQPMPRASASLMGIGCAVITSLGGGLLGCDDVEVDVVIGPGAKAWLGTQASTKIYKKDNNMHSDLKRKGTRSSLKVKLAKNGMLVWAPDAIVPYKNCVYRSKSFYEIDPDATLVSVEWTQSGRAHSGERWELGFYETRSQWRIQNHSIIDATRLANAEAAKLALDLGGQPRDVFGTVALYGVPATIVKRFDSAARAAASNRGARIHFDTTSLDDVPPDSVITGLAAVGISTTPIPIEDVPKKSHSTTTNQFILVRFVAFGVEDAYRMLHWCLAPLKDTLGFEPYADRIHARASPVVQHETYDASSSRIDLLSMKQNQGIAPALFSGPALMLADSALPTGGFAHSGGLEAALQLGVLRPNDETTLLEIMSNLAMSHQALYLPFALAATSSDINILYKLDSELDALLRSHAQAYLASTRQGAALLRVRQAIMQQSQRGNKDFSIRHGPIAFGLLAREMGLSVEAIQVVFAYTAIRDTFSAAVRLNIIGPLSAIPLQARILRSYPSCKLDSNTLPLPYTNEFILLDLADRELPASGAPFLDSLHASHSFLDMRLFQT